MPVPLARCAFSRRSNGTSTVILRAVSMSFYTILETSMEYGISSSDKVCQNSRKKVGEAGATSQQGCWLWLDFGADGHHGSRIGLWRMAEGH